VDLVTANTFERILEIQTELGAGTAFTIERAGHEYLVTARHLLPQGTDQPEVTISSRHMRRTLRLHLLPVEPESADVAVASLDEPVTPTLPLPTGRDGIIWGQNVFFLGFPYGLATEFARGEPEQRLAFVKRALFSASADVDGVSYLYLDGMNNPGFSGGPVVFNRDGNHLTPQVCGVIAGYRTERQPVYQGTTPIASLEASANAGIIIATDIRHVTEAIDQTAA
jgi:S1-C subfamily serine protease